MDASERARSHSREEADKARSRAVAAYKRGDTASCDTQLRLAARCYRAAGQAGMALWCERFIGE